MDWERILMILFFFSAVCIAIGAVGLMWVIIKGDPYEMACPHCGRRIHMRNTVCPRCKRNVTPVSKRRMEQRLCEIWIVVWVIAMALFLFAAVLVD